MTRILNILDGDAILHPHFHKANDDYTSPDGQSVGMLYRSFGTFRKFLEAHSDNAFVIAFDPIGKTSWRYRDFPGYKPGRPEKTENFIYQKREIMKLLTAFGIPYYFNDEYESDDWIYSSAEHAINKGYKVKVGAQDKDLYGLLKHTDVEMCHPIKMTPFTKEDLYAKWRIQPHQIDDFLALLGDKVDGIPGVEKWGPAFVSDALNKFETLENIIENQQAFDGIKGQNLKHVAHLLIKQRNFLRLRNDLPVDVSHWEMTDPNPDDILQLLKKHGFMYWYHDVAKTYKQK